MKDFPMIRSVRAGVVGTALIAVPLLALSCFPLTGVYVALLTLLVLPVALCTVGLVCGLLPMLVSAAFGLFSLYRAMGSMALGLGAVYVLPILLAFLVIVSQRIPFWKGCAILIGVHVAALAAVYLLLQQGTGGNLYTAAGDAAASALQDWELGDMMLYQLYTMGLIGLPEKLADGMLLPVLGGYTLSAAARTDLLLSLRTLMNSLLTLWIPSTIVSQSLLGGVGCLLLPLRFGYVAAERRAFRGNATEGYVTREDGRQAVDFPDLGMPPLSLWHLPRGIGWKVGAALAVGYFLRQSAAPAAAIAGILLYSAASSIFTIQGMALIHFMQKSRGVRMVWRVVVPLVLLLFSVLSLVGIFDQMTNIRGLRKPREPKEE